MGPSVVVVGIEDTVVVSLLSVVSLDVDVVVPISVNQVRIFFLRIEKTSESAPRRVREGFSALNTYL